MRVLKENDSRILVEESFNYCVIYRKVDGGVSFIGSTERMLLLFRRLELIAPAIAARIEFHMKTYRDGKPWEKYQEWLEERSKIKERN